MNTPLQSNASERFFRNQHIRLSSDFEKFRSRNVSKYQSILFTLKMLNDGRSVSRLGIITSKKIGNAVIRNEMRRILRDIFRKKLQKCGGSYDYLVIVKKRSPYEKIEIELLNAAAILHEQTSLRRREL